jgi:hypothetical protein
MTAWIADTDVQGWIGADKIALDAAGSLAQTATDVVMSYIERDVSLTTTSDFYDTNGTDFILLNHWPVISIGSVTLNGTPLVPAAPNVRGWRMDSFNQRKLIFAGMGKQIRGNMNCQVIDLVAGYDTTQPLGSPTALGGHIVQALKLTAAAIFNSQAADPNLANESMTGVFSGTFYATGVGAIPPGARTLLTREMRASP